MISDRIAKFLLVSLLLFVCTGCSKKEITPDEAARVIEEFNSKDYSYTVEYYNLGLDGSKDVLDERKGMKTEEPYIQYEITTLEPPQGEYEKYWIENDGNLNFYVTIALSGNQKTAWITSSGKANKEARGTNWYDRDGLEYKFDRIEEQCFVVSAEYEVETPVNSYPPGLSDDPNATINMTLPVKVEYYIDKETEKVDSIHILQLGTGRVMEISKLVADGMKFEDAEESVDHSGKYGYPEMDYQITYEKDIEISIPDDLPVQ